MATLSRVLVWRLPWTEEPGGLQSMGLHAVGRDLATNTLISGFIYTTVLQWGVLLEVVLVTRTEGKRWPFSCEGSSHAYPRTAPCVCLTHTVPMTHAPGSLGDDERDKRGCSLTDPRLKGFILGLNLRPAYTGSP